MPPTEEDLAWFNSTFHPIPRSTLPDDCVEYSLHIVSPTLDPSSDAELRLRLRDVQKRASELQKRWLKDYIWQRQGFAIELIREDGSSLLRGRTEYGDSVEDEWVVVWLLRELTRTFPDLWVKVADNDGEFLLVEAAGTLPGWLEPDVAENRVWIHNGNLTIVKPQSDAKSQKKRQAGKLSLKDAQKIVLTDQKRLLRSVSIEEEAFYRLRNYPQQIGENMHHALVTVPRKIALLLHQKPAYISPATEAFYLRDPIALKPLQMRNNDDLIFKPVDLVTISVKLPRVGYAQLRSQDFPPPSVWTGKMPLKTTGKDQSRAETGMKVSCGFEMLLSDPQNQDKPAVREMKMILEDLDTGDETLPSDADMSKWSMQEDDEKWLDISFEDLESELSGAKGQKGDTKKGGDFGHKATQENLQRIVAQFEQFMNDDTAGPDGAGLFGEVSEDDEPDSDDDDDGDVDSESEEQETSFDEDEFTKMMREMMGMPGNVMQEIMGKGLAQEVATAGNKSAPQPKALSRRAENNPSHIIEELPDNGASDSDSQTSSDSEEIQSLTQRMEAELRQTGALNINPPITPQNKTSKRSPLQHSSALKPDAKGKGKAVASSSSNLDELDSDLESDGDEHDEKNEDEDDDEEEDIDINLVRNLLESLKGQAGMAGPGGNLMGLLGLKMPRDEGEEG